MDDEYKKLLLEMQSMNDGNKKFMMEMFSTHAKVVMVMILALVLLNVVGFVLIVMQLATITTGG